MGRRQMGGVWRIAVTDDDILVAARALAKSYPSPEGAVSALAGVDLSIRAGESVAIVGESGSGKSTLLHLIAGLDAPSAGTLRVAGVDIGGADDAARATLRREKVGLVFQQFNLIPSLGVAANLAFQARLAGRHDPARMAALARALGLSSLLDRWPEQLSGGQQQRVAIGRALAAAPPLLLCDEPTGNLDEATGASVADLLFRLAAEHGTTLILVTHSPQLAARCGRILRLHGGKVDESART